MEEPSFHTHFVTKRGKLFTLERKRLARLEGWPTLPGHSSRRVFNGRVTLLAEPTPFSSLETVAFFGHVVLNRAGGGGRTRMAQLGQSETIRACASAVGFKWINFFHIERFHSHGRHLCKFIGTKERVCIRREFNSHRIGLGHQHGRRFVVLGHYYGCRDVMWKHSISAR